MNSVNLVGRLVRDPELRHTPSGVSVCTMRIAVDRAGGSKDGESKAGFFDVEAWKDQAENCARYLTKGRQVGVTGALQFREWEAQDGTKRNAVEIRAFNVTFLGSKEDGTGTPGGSSGATPATTNDDFGGGADDDIPF